MGTIKTFFAILKAYCAINVLLLPMSFTEGGYIVSPLAMLVGCLFETNSAVKLSKIAIKYQMFTYPAVAEKAIGKTGKTVVRVLIALASF